MIHYSLKYAIPIESNSKGLFYKNNTLYFANNTYLYKISDYSIEMCGSLNSEIRSITVKDSIIYSINEDSLVLTNNRMNIASLKSNSYCINVNEHYIVLGGDSLVEIWKRPYEYKMGMFDLVYRFTEHSAKVVCLYAPDENVIYSGSVDCSIRSYDIKEKTSKKVVNTKTIPLGIFRINEELVIVCEGGQIMYLNIESNTVEHRIYLQNNISCVSSFDDLLGVCVLKDNKSVIEIYKDKELLYSFEIEEEIKEMCLYKKEVFVKGPKFIGIYNYEADCFLYKQVLPKIVCFDIRNELLAVGCTDRKIRIYESGNKFNQTLCDDKNTHPIYKLHLLQSSILSISINGHISIFDLNNGTCYRSFNIPVKISASVICSEGMLLFLADYDTYKIRIIDLQRSREVDSLEGHEAPINYMSYSSNYLYTLSLDNKIIRWNIYNNTNESIDLERPVISMILSNNKLYTVLRNEILIYNLDLEYLTSISYKTSTGTNKIVSNKMLLDKVGVSFDDRFLFLGGISNKIFVYDITTGYLEETMKVSRNINLNNYKDKKTKRNQEEIGEDIEVLGIKHSSNKYLVYVHTKEGILMYTRSTSKYLPLTMDIQANFSSIKEYIKEKKYLNAIIGILRLQEFDLLMEIINRASEQEIEFIIKYIPDEHIKDLKDFLISNLTNIKVIKWLRYLNRRVEVGITKKSKELEDSYKTVLENIFILENILE